ncbi:Hypothetical predicted protein [Mytilus galloprovincialis]|uniref:Uncharacterized protein n=1 Tax=Mytilus galloprovincialis TaxID=29158 RepID=A0A8B6BJC9_MYTGA|nr:Hypothetical predicted protein [Mytilus galloprovincialis]
MSCLVLVYDDGSREYNKRYPAYNIDSEKPIRPQLNSLIRLMMTIDLHVINLNNDNWYDRRFNFIQTGSGSPSDYVALTIKSYLMLLGKIGFSPQYELSNDLSQYEMESRGCLQGIRINNTEHCIFSVPFAGFYRDTGDVDQKTEFVSVLNRMCGIRGGTLLNIHTHDDMRGMFGFIKRYNAQELFYVGNVTELRSNEKQDALSFTIDHNSTMQSTLFIGDPQTMIMFNKVPVVYGDVIVEPTVIICRDGRRSNRSPRDTNHVVRVTGPSSEREELMINLSDVPAFIFNIKISNMVAILLLAVAVIGFICIALCITTRCITRVDDEDRTNRQRTKSLNFINDLVDSLTKGVKQNYSNILDMKRNLQKEKNNFVDLEKQIVYNHLNDEDEKHCCSDHLNV